MWGDDASSLCCCLEVSTSTWGTRLLIAMQVACGPYHMAIVTASGALFTCGDGFGGKLGHGGFASEGSPRQVCNPGRYKQFACWLRCMLGMCSSKLLCVYAVGVSCLAALKAC